MRRRGMQFVVGLVLLGLLLVGCEGYTQTGARTVENQSSTLW